MKTRHAALFGAILAATTTAAHADIVVDYTIDHGGSNPYGPSGLAAQGTFSVDGDQLTIVLTNTSTDVPTDASVADSLLVSLGFELDGATIASGDSALIADGSIGLGQWSHLAAGDSVASEWLWTNEAGGDVLKSWHQIISTSQGYGGGDAWDFNGSPTPGVSGPFGGIASDPAQLTVPDSQYAVSDSIEFHLTLSRAITDAELALLAQSSIVEFGSDYQYLAVPAPGALALVALAGLSPRRRRTERTQK